ncbi:hypothetical protein O6P43_018038 [Quillaja saponaria]|uniref:Uncharacterized protein n=1 Tax=Quillaja saponaria TaxID=32244 RepID=A0AAD7LR98_QUISA|nr:hypothetical protein O6P43_018038 [Quillaja saponaria]
MVDGQTALFVIIFELTAKFVINRYMAGVTQYVKMIGAMILRRGGAPTVAAGQEMAMMEVKIVGLFWLHNEASIGTNWTCRMVKNDGNPVESFLLDDNGDNIYRDSDTDDWLEIRGVKGCFKSAPNHGKLYGQWTKEKPWPDSDSDFDSNSDTDRILKRSQSLIK